jgi:tRNA(Ile)-lysidine synthase TilS/MesJ
MDKLIYRVNTNIRERFLLKKNEKNLVAVSGGQDSIFFIANYNFLKKKLELDDWSNLL